MMMQGKFNGRIFRDEDIIITKIIGQGNWSHVYEGFNTSKTRKYAVKVISEEKFRSTPKIRELTNAEINILKECNNPNVIKMHKSFSQEGHIFMVLDYCNQGDLGKLLEEEGTLPEPIALVYLKQILNGFRGLHEVKAMHRDFKV
jgi:serine/threonine protein kinase